MPVTATDVVTDRDVFDMVAQVRNDYLQVRRAFRDHDATGLDSNTFDFPTAEFEFDGEAVEVPEGSDYPRASKSYDDVRAVYTKYGFEVPISDQAVMDSKIDVEADVVIDMAKAEERRVEEIAFNVLKANTDTTNGPVDEGTVSNQIEYADMIKAREILFDNEYSINDTIILTDAANSSDILAIDEFRQASDLGDAVIEAGLLPEGALADQGYLGQFIDIPVYVTSTVSMTAGEAYMIDTSNYGYESTRQPMETLSYREEEKDQDVFKVRGRWDWVSVKPSACIEIDG